MKDMERQSFEQELKKAFDHAEVSPSDNLWTNIELDLIKAESEGMKRRLLFYKLMAAASITFAVCVAGIGTYYFKHQNSFLASNDLSLSSITEKQISAVAPLKPTTNLENQIYAVGPKAENETADNNRVALNKKQSALSKTNPTDFNNKIASSDQQKILKAIRTSNIKYKINRSTGSDHLDVESDNSHLDPILVSQSGQTSERIIDEQFSLNSRKLPALFASKTAVLKFPKNEVDPVVIMLAKLEQRELELRGKDEEKKTSSNKNEKIWTSLGFATGAYTATNTNVNNGLNGVANSVVASNSVTANQSKAAGTSYSVGLHIGTRLTDRWILQGGVNYMTQNSDYQANAVVTNSSLQSFRTASLNDNVLSANSGTKRVVATAPYNVNSNLQYVSVPMQAGYLILNRIVGVQLNAGVSTDLFLQSTVSPESTSTVAKVTQGRGEDSPYRPVNFSGLFGTEFSYRFGKHYRVALNPGLRYPFGSIYKPQVGVTSNPLAMDVGMKVRYIFH